MRKFLILLGILFFLAFQGQAAETTWRHSGFELWGFDINFTNHNASNVELVNGVNFTESLKEDYNYLVYNTSGTNYNCGSVVSWCYVVQNGTTKKTELATTSPSTALTYTVNTGSNPTKIELFGDFVFTSCPINRCLNLSGKSNITIIGRGTTKFIAGRDNLRIIYSDIQLSNPVLALADINESNNTISIDVTGYNKGDWININSSARFSPDTATIFEGEVQQIEGTDANINELYIVGSTFARYNVSDGAQIRRFVNMSNNIEISGIAFKGYNVNSSGIVGEDDTIAILFYGGSNIKVHDVSCDFVGTYCIWLSSAIDSDVYNNRIYYTNRNAYGDGVAIGEASQNVEVYNNKIKNNRHGVSLNTDLRGATGLARNVRFHHNQITNSSSYAMDAHAAGTDIWFENNDISGFTWRAPNSQGAGIAYGTRRTFIYDNRIDGGRRDITVGITTRQSSAREVYIEGNTITNLYGGFSHGIVLSMYLKSGRACRNVINNTDGAGIRVDHLNTSELFVVCENTINTQNTSWSAIRTEGAMNVSFEDNIILSQPAWLDLYNSNVFWRNNYGFYDINQIRGDTTTLLNGTNHTIASISTTNISTTGNFDMRNESVSDRQLLLNLKFDENKTGVVLDPTVYDSSVYGLKGTFIGNTTANYTDGMFGSAMLFDGSNDYVNLNTFNQLSNTGSFTISGWIYPTDVSQTQTVYQNALSATNIVAISITAGTFAAGAYDGATYLGRKSGTVANNKWYYFLYTYRNSAGVLYLNGIEQTTDTNNPSSGVTIGSRLGMRTTEDNPYFGKIDEFRIYNRTLSDQEAKTLYYSNPLNERTSIIQTNNFTVVNSTGQPTLQVNSTGVFSNFTMPVCSKSVVNQTGSMCLNMTSEPSPNFPQVNIWNGTRWTFMNGTGV